MSRCGAFLGHRYRPVRHCGQHQQPLFCEDHSPSPRRGCPHPGSRYSTCCLLARGLCVRWETPRRWQQGVPAHIFTACGRAPSGPRSCSPVPDDILRDAHGSAPMERICTLLTLDRSPEQIQLSLPLYSRGTRSTDRFHNLPRVTQLISGESQPCHL